MERTLRGRRDRAILYIAANGKCRMCGRPLPANWHADHVVPWSETHRTNIHEMQALCPACNLRKRNGFMDLSHARPGQLEAFKVAIERLRAGESQTALVLPCGYGKRDLILMIAFHCWNEGMASCSLVLSPNEYLRDQMIDIKKFKEFTDRYRPTPKHRRELRRAAIPALDTSVNYAANGEFLLSSTMQLVKNNVPIVVKWVESTFHRTGKPVIVMADETHTNRSNRWGEVIKCLRDAGAHIIVVTATPLSEDGEPLIGFDMIEKSNEPVILTKTRPGSTLDKVKVSIWAGTQTHWELKAHYQHTFHDAWDEGVLCHVNHQTFDMNLGIIGEDETKMLSDLSEADTRRVLGKFTRHPEVIRCGCAMLAHWLTFYRSAVGFMGKDTAGIVFCGNDVDEKVNDHAQKIKDELFRIDRSLRAVIATSANDIKTGSKSGKQILEEFVYDGVGDVLIVKQMAGLGLDARRPKIILDLSPIRTPVSFIQKVNRATRPYNGIMTAVLITPRDVLSNACFDELIESEGGATTKEIELQTEYEIDRSTAPTTEYILRSVGDSDVRDTKNKTATRAQIAKVVRFVGEFPVLIGAFTIPEIAERLDTLGMTLAEEDEDSSAASVNTGDQLERLRRSVTPVAKQITKIRMAKIGRRYSAQQEDKELFGETIKGVWKEVYQAARMPADFDYEKCRDVALLEAVYSAMDSLLAHEVGV